MTTTRSTGFRGTYLLLAAVALMLAGLAVYVMFIDEEKTGPEGLLLESFASIQKSPEKITGLEIEKGDDKIVLSRQPDGRWRIVKPFEARADSDRVEAIVGELLSVRADDKSADLKKDLAAEGLDHPPVKVTLHKGDQTAWLALGKTTVGGEQAVVYALANNDPSRPHAILKSRLKDLYKAKPSEGGGTAGLVVDAGDLRTTKLLGERMQFEASPQLIDGVRLTFNAPDGKKVIYLKKTGPNRWQFAEPSGYGDVRLDVPPQEANPNTIYNLKSLLYNILSIDVHDRKDIVPVQDLAAVNLSPTSPGALRIDIERQDPIGTETLWLSQAPAKDDKGKPNDARVYARYEGDPSVATVNGDRPLRLFNFVKDPRPLRDLKMVALPPDRIDAIDVTMNKTTFELRKLGDKWKVGQGDKHNDANPGAVDALIQKLLQPARGFPPPGEADAAMELEHPAVEVKIWAAALPTAKEAPKEWPKLNGPPNVRLEFGKKDIGDIVFVRRYVGDVRADFKMPADVLDVAKRGRLDYVNIALKRYNPNLVEQFVLTRDGETWSLEFQNGAWIVLAPPAKKGRYGDPDKIIEILKAFDDENTLKVVSEKATPDQLATLGLDPAKPVFKLTLKLKEEPAGKKKDESAERVYYLGNQVSGKAHVFAKTGSSDYVFEWPLSKLELATKGRLLEPYHIEPGNVKAMKLRGWVDPAKPGEPQALEFARKPGGIWTTTSKFPYDAAKVEEFFQALMHPKEIDIGKADPKMAPKLELKDGALQVELDVGEAKPITITLGGPAGKDGIYVTASQTPGETFTLDNDRLLPVRDKMDALKVSAPAEKK